MQPKNRLSSVKSIRDDLIAGLVVFLVALPLCLGVALASNAPLAAGLIAGILGGIVVGFISGSNTSVSGPAAGLTAVIAAQIGHLGTFEALLTAIMIAGIIQIILSICQLGFIAAFFPSSVIKGLLCAIGIILILKQIPHVLGYDADPIGNKSFHQADNQNTFSGLFTTMFNIHAGAAVIGVFSLALLILWDKLSWLKKSPIPAPLVVIIVGIALSFILQQFGGHWSIESSHLVQVPVAELSKDLLNFLTFPDFSVLNKSAVYTAAITIAVVASLETLLNLEAIDKIDPLQRNSPPNRELLAQGIANTLSGLIGGLPVTSVIVRSSVNINAGVKTKLSTIWHGLLLLGSVIFVPAWLNHIPLSALAAILLVTGMKLTSPQMLMQMWKAGKYQFLPFIITVSAIVVTDLLVGVLIGLGTAICFILNSNIRRPLKKVIEKHSTGDEVLHIELPNQVSFFNRATLDTSLKNAPKGGHILIDATNTDYIDPDILDLIIDFQNTSNKTKKSLVSLIGFKDKYPKLEDHIQYIDFSNRASQASLTPVRVLEILQEGNARFRQGTRLIHNLDRQLKATSTGQFPMAVILSCIDSRSPAELIFDLSLGDILSVRVAGNVVGHKILGSIEYGCAVAGAKLLLVMGHTSCGAVKASVDLLCDHKTASETTGCTNLDSLVAEIQQSINAQECQDAHDWSPEKKETYCNDIAFKNVLRTMREIRQSSPILDNLVRQGKVAIAGAMYDISTAKVTFFQDADACAPSSDIHAKHVDNSRSFKNFILKSLRILNNLPK